MASDKQSEIPSDDVPNPEDQVEETIEEMKRRQFGFLVDNRAYELIERVKNSKYQPLKLTLILTLVAGFVYWILVYMEIATASF